jgi:hypothetical protein
MSGSLTWTRRGELTVRGPNMTSGNKSRELIRPVLTCPVWLCRGDAEASIPPFYGAGWRALSYEAVRPGERAEKLASGRVPEINHCRIGRDARARATRHPR